MFFVLLTFLFSTPTWWIMEIQDDKLHFLIWDLSQFIRISLLPLMAFMLIKEKHWKIICLMYFGWTATNIVSSFIEYYSITESWMTFAKVSGALLILIYTAYIMRKKYKWNGIK